MNFSSDNFETFKSKYHDVAEHYKGKSISFLLGDLESSQGAFQVIFLILGLCLMLVSGALHCSDLSVLLIDLDEQYFGLKEDQVPLIIIQKNDGQKYLKQHLEPDHIAPWLKEYMVMFLLSFQKYLSNILHV